MILRCICICECDVVHTVFMSRGTNVQCIRDHVCAAVTRNTCLTEAGDVSLSVIFVRSNYWYMSHVSAVAVRHVKFRKRRVPMTYGFGGVCS